MKFRLAALAALLIAWASLVPAQSAAPPRETIKTVFTEAIPNVPGKSLVGVIVSYSPGGATPAHHHARSAFITGYVLSGSIRSQVNHGEVRIYHAGETWTEPPGADHEISENASATEPASLLAIFVVDSNEIANLTTLNRQ
jgi:quercetin dioxygenase-like cupin family protein